RLATALADAFDAAGVGAQVPQAGTLVGLFFSDRPVRDYDDAHAANHKTYAAFFHGLLDRGVYIAPSGYEVLFPSLAHGDVDLDDTFAAATEAANTLGR
ncbi:MAG TPA: aspartate aminotransferase family protein, partial [Acidimicrobiia bacterium]|nr:aspartate aminotransferase family protein [Acidimicrobiia bacterium]